MKRLALLLILGFVLSGFSAWAESQPEQGKTGSTAPASQTVPRQRPRPAGGKQGTPPISSAEFERKKAQAEAARDTDQIPEAIALYEQLLKLRPNWAEGWWHVGAMNYDRDEYVGAAQAFAKFVVLEPENGQGWGMLGLCEFRLKKRVEALQHLTKSRTLGLGGNEDLARVVRYHQALLFNLGKQFATARGILAGFAVEDRESPAVLDALGMSVLRVSEPLESLSEEQLQMIRAFGKAAFLEAARKQPDSIDLYGSLAAQYEGRPNVACAYGSALAKRGESEKAVVHFQKEIERDPRHVSALLQLALELISLSRLEEALTHAQKAAAIEPENPLAFYIQGRIFLSQEELQKAIRMLEIAERLAPRFSQTRYLLAQAYQRSGRKEDAQRERGEFEKLREIEKQRQGTLGTFLPEPGESEP